MIFELDLLNTVYDYIYMFSISTVRDLQIPVPFLFKVSVLVTHVVE